MTAPLALLAARFEPHHLARLRAASARGPVTPFEFAGSEVTASAFLDLKQPRAVAIPGYSRRACREALAWCLRRRVPAILMTDSKADDFPRRAPGESVKAALLRGFSAALVSGSRSREYIQALGFDGAVRDGYDVVDVEVFRPGADPPTPPPGIPPRYWLAVARMVPRKGHAAALDAYGSYRRIADSPLPLVLVGDGPQREGLEQQCRDRGFATSVHFAGGLPPGDVAALYQRAAGLLHLAERDQWGLVIGEAIASGLPVIASPGAGAAWDLIVEGRNGFVVDPARPALAAERMIDCEARRAEFSAESLRIAAAWGPERFAAHLWELVELAKPARAPLAARLLAEALAPWPDRP
ncbi:MAG: glycosyltransferase [Candidatus Sumerlaeia bacterium]|nr:glycosyltransferase [Candidatus Sumerlaeia bacterium]